MSKPKNQNVKPRRREDEGLWAVWKRWLRRNEKVLWVILLILIAPLMAFTFPVTQFMASGPSDYAAARFYDEDVTVADVKKVQRLFAAVQQVAPMTLYETGRLFAREREFDAVDFYLYKRTAERLGIRVSDPELGDRIRSNWRMLQARRLVLEEMSSDPSGNPAQQGQLFQAKLDELEKNNAFDQAEWVESIRQSGVTLVAFESILRDLYTIGKLQSYVENSVKVSPQEVFERFNEEEQKRKLSWISWKTNEELDGKIRDTISDDTLESYYEDNRFRFAKPLAIRADYVLIPENHFESSAGASIADEDLQKYYDEHRNDYRTASLNSDESLFTLRSKEEQSSLEGEVYRSLEEVKDDVREKLLVEKSDLALREFGDELRGKLFPESGDAMSAEALTAQYPFLKIGKTDYATRADAKDVFGEVYDEFEVRGWFPRAGAPDAVIEPSKVARTVDAGRIFYTKIDIRPRREPELDEVRDEVLDAVVKREAVTAIGNTLRDAVGAVEDSADGADSDELAGKYEEKLNELLASGVEVTAGDSKLRLMPTTELITALEYVDRRSFELTYASPEEDTKEEDNKE
ncbi:MAG: hypothetical protein MK538_16890 [Planctomycetes bacterium]|nr:hypothetical protein [Planctomycetota bacterium]